ncbi:TadE/TadG family type IV pilus assembly protein [Sphingorhabdus sp. SMR4y]|uniref:TadE/TadG family type IV pilus assembly protein n=1 Tax=Sphingorhabdus sp. SMR4y TaxID=2584094 RepID=UPI000B5C9709|nr:TadE family protein [Sphingorhabdus sp. SMR4y]ASK87790.1 TadE-like protein [Sphingorhabdus sp. SMR4y]
MRGLLKKFRALKRDDGGAALVEFALVSPVLILLIMGMLDLGHRIYATAILQGSVQKAARDASLDDGSANASAIDDRVKELMLPVLQPEPISDFEFTRKNYSDFSDVAQPEDFTDTNNDGECNNGEPYDDVNGNDSWDADRGAAGQGNAKDAVLYTVKVTYPRLFPMAGLVGMSQDEVIQASTVVRNQPFGEQSDRGEIKNCT